jgi:hypothetical protein
MTEPVETDHAAAMMAVLEEIVAGSRGLVSDWALLTHAQAALERGGLEGLVSFYRAAIEQPSSRTTWIKATLEAHNRKTLASEYARFMALYKGALPSKGARHEDRSTTSPAHMK